MQRELIIERYEDIAPRIEERREMQGYTAVRAGNEWYILLGEGIIRPCYPNERPPANPYWFIKNG